MAPPIFTREIVINVYFCLAENKSRDQEVVQTETEDRVLSNLCLDGWFKCTTMNYSDKLDQPLFLVLHFEGTQLQRGQI